VTQENAILCGRFEGFTWIRVEGKGSFLVSPALKDCFERRQEEGERRFVVDLGGCSGMDSTFMGNLAGLASRMAKHEGWVMVADPGERNRQSLVDLGLDCLIEIDPPDAPWSGRTEELRGELEPFDGRASVDGERQRHVLDSHRTLAATSEENARRFRGVIEVMEGAESSSARGGSPRR